MVLALSISSVMMYGAALIAIGIGLRLFVSQRRFNRRGYGGAQHYSTYWSAIFISTFEGILMIASALAIVSGIFLLVVELFNNR
ncbi:hypothetical protein SAMN04487996_117170 [Dyadobacter soli]|uniref:Uncharacterized protein n=1 Tax=Dyadobacter soli TaxID=659014 RepID=A0A1G7TCH9_9BACT|nr:hypothetical protein SAMN04487996_117170 [Dyadobacter soli]